VETPPPPATLAAPAEVAKEIPPVIVPELPKTASPYPLIGLAGLLALIVFAVVRIAHLQW